MIRAVFGGSFDPVHVGHVAMVDHLLDEGLADEVHVVPSWLSPHKNSFSASPADRLSMVRLAFGDRANVEIETLEVDQGNVGFTVDTLDALSERHRRSDWRFVLGWDNLHRLPSWKDAPGILARARVLAFEREGVTLDLDGLRARGLDPDRIDLVTGFDQPVSASNIRAILASENRENHPELRRNLPAPVLAYIVDRDLYRR